MSRTAISVEVRGISAIHRALRPILEPEITELLRAANKRAAQQLARALRAEARPISRRMARAVRVRRAKDSRTGWVVGSRRKIAPFWHLVIGGTRAHGPKRAKRLVWKDPQGRRIVARRVRGVAPHPIVDRVARANEALVARGIEVDFRRHLK